MEAPRPHDPLFVLREHTDSVLCCSFFKDSNVTSDSPVTNWLLTGDVSGVVKLWDLSLRRSLLTFHPFSEAKKTDKPDLAPPTASSLNPGIISAGFLWLTDSLSPQEHAQNLPEGSKTSSALTSPPEADGETTVLREIAATERTSQRRRFRLARPTQPLPVDASGAVNTPDSETLTFYTQCRNQNLYIWSLKVSTNGRRDASAVLVPDAEQLRLEYKLFIPQHGFCPVDAFISDHTSGFLAVPHDTNGQVTVWHISRRDALDSHRPTPSHVVTERKEFDLVQGDTKAPNTDPFAGMDPRAALIARGQAEEDAQRLAMDRVSSGDATVAAVTEASAVSISHACTFSASGSTFKGGVIMQIRIRDKCHLSVAFESGHVALCQYRPCCSAAGDVAVEAFRPLLLCTTRMFAEPAATCLWTSESAAGENETQRVVATSASGHVQCYTLTAPDMAPELCWEQRFPKGLGSAALQGHLLVIGAWDRTVRVLEVRSGRLLSILTQHSGTVQQVAVVPSRGVAIHARFGFDSRHPHLYAADARLLILPPSSSSSQTRLIPDASAPHAPSVLPFAVAEDLIYLFCSCSDDGTVAVWRVDLHDVVFASRGNPLPLRLS